MIVGQESITRALAVMEAHIKALNEHNATTLAATLHFPHYRLHGTTIKIWATPNDYFDDFLQRAGSEWHHSTFNDIRVLQSSADKVHLDAEIRRYRQDDTLITSFRSLWVITQLNGVWAAQFRSSFAQR